MAEVVLDASAILAVIFDEPGSNVVEDRLPGALASAVNIAEVATRLLALEMPHETLETVIDSLQLSIQPYDYDQALVTGQLRALTRAAGLSLGDRACLALSKVKQVEVLTSDKAWKGIAESVGVSVTLIR